MSDAASTDPGSHHLAGAAARGGLPDWSVAGPRRREHIERVAALMAEWADALGLSAADRERWLAAAWLHDALRDADPQVLRRILPATYVDFPDPLLHGPAAAERLRHHVDGEVSDAIRYHTVGHPAFGRLGCALYLADFLEPGREFLEDWRGTLRARMPGAIDDVLMDVLAARIRHLLESRKPIRPETAAFWSAVARRRA